MDSYPELGPVGKLIIEGALSLEGRPRVLEEGGCRPSPHPGWIRKEEQSHQWEQQQQRKDREDLLSLNFFRVKCHWVFLQRIK